MHGDPGGVRGRRLWLQVLFVLGTLARREAAIAVQSPAAGDRQQPGCDGAAARVIRDGTPPDLEPCLLEYILGLHRASQDAQHHRVEQGRVAVVELSKSTLIPGLEPQDPLKVAL